MKHRLATMSATRVWARNIIDQVIASAEAPNSFKCSECSYRGPSVEDVLIHKTQHRPS